MELRRVLQILLAVLLVLPASVRQIADTAFDGCSAKLIITAPEGSYAQQWAESRGIRVKVVK